MTKELKQIYLDCLLLGQLLEFKNNKLITTNRFIYWLEQRVYKFTTKGIKKLNYNLASILEANEYR